MSLSVALQSVLFYVVACTPCAQVRHRQKSRKQAKKEREEKAKLELAQPDLYRHPDPFSTNPYWTEEILMGPSLPKKGRKTADASKNPSQRGLTSAGQESGIGTRSSFAISNAGTSSSTTDTLNTAKPSGQNRNADETETATAGVSSPTSESEHTIVASTPAADEPTSPTLTQIDSISTRSDWNYKRYQREDEELWGHGISKTGLQLMDAIKHAGSSAGRFVEAKLGKDKQVTDEDRHNFYFTPKNPPVNDYHPPVVSSKPAHPDGHRWMLQPPPSAKVMEGRVPVSRSASLASMASRRTAATTESLPLGRLVGERAVGARIRKGEVPSDSAMLSTSSITKSLARRPTTSTARSGSQRTLRSRSHSLSTDSESSPTEAVRQKRRPRARARPPVTADSDSEDEWISKSIEQFTSGSVAMTAHPTHAAQRPRLSTILSSDQTGADATVPPLRDVTNASPAPKSNTSSKSNDTATAVDSGVALPV